MTDHEQVSHGRGGQGNIGPDDTQYVDGEIHREGNPEATGGAYSSGRGGAGNMGSPGQTPLNTGSDEDVVPEPSKLQAKDEPYHQGRGGEGNAVPAGSESPKLNHEGLADKLKKKLFKASPKKSEKKAEEK